MSSMIEALKRSGKIDDQFIAEWEDRQAEEQVKLAELGREMEEVDGRLSVAKSRLERASSDLVGKIEQAQGFIEQGVRIQYWRGVVEDYTKRHTEAEAAYAAVSVEATSLLDRYEALTGERPS